MRLDNGIPFYTFDNPQLELIHLSIRVEAGALHETQKQLSRFCYTLWKESHPEKNSNETDDFLDYYGATLSVTAGICYITIQLQFPRKSGGKVIPFVAEMLHRPVFRAHNLELLRAKFIKEFDYQSQKVDYRNTQLMMHHLFGPKFTFGKILTTSDFEEISLEGIQEYFRETCCAERIRIFAAGHLDPETVELVCQHFSRIPNGTPAPMLEDIHADYIPQRIHEEWPDSLQTSLSLCRPVMKHNDPDSLPFSIFNTLFCNYFGSRLMQNLREKNGFTYGISGAPFYYSNGAFFYIESEVNCDKTEEAIEACFTEMRRLQQQAIPKEEMDTVRNYLLGSAIRTIDGTITYMRNYIEWNDFGEDENRFNQYVKLIRSIRPEEITALAEKYLLEQQFTVITVGKNQN